MESAVLRLLPQALFLEYWRHEPRLRVFRAQPCHQRRLSNQSNISDYDFLSSIPKDIQEIIENRPRQEIIEWIDNSLTSSPLMAAQSNFPYQSRLDSVGIDGTIWQDGLIENRPFTSEVHKLQSTSEIRTTKVRSTKSSFFQESIGKVGFLEVRPVEHRLEEDSPSKISSFQVDLFKTSFGQSSLPHVNTTQVGIDKRGPFQVSSLQIRSTEDDSIKFFVEQANSLEVQTPKSPLPSSVTLQQFLSSHNFNLQNTTIPTWTEFLTVTTPFNLNIEITDLPTGQLAEANTAILTCFLPLVPRLCLGIGCFEAPASSFVS